MLNIMQQLQEYIENEEMERTKIRKVKIINRNVTSKMISSFVFKANLNEKENENAMEGCMLPSKGKISEDPVA